MRRLIRPGRVRAFTLLEMIVTGLVSVLLGAAVWTLLRTSYDNQYVLMNQNMVATNSRRMVDTFADNLRGAKAITAGDGSSITYMNSSGQSVKYWKSGTNLLKTVDNLPAGGTTAIANVSALSFIYWVWNGTAWSGSTSATTPANVSAVDFSLTLLQNGSSRKISGSAKIRQK
jgi:hypothetical protein